MEYTYKYPRPALTVDMVVLSMYSDKVLLIRRKNEPFKDCWALPGGFVNMDETCEDAAVRELEEETSLTVHPFSPCLVGVFSRVDRDPRERVISVAYYTVLEDVKCVNAKAADDAAELKWFDMRDLPDNIAFDHRRIITLAHSLYISY